MNLIFVQEWYLYKYIESEKKEVTKDRADPTLLRATVTVRCKAARRSAYYIWNIFSVTVSAPTFSLLNSRLQLREPVKLRTSLRRGGGVGFF